MGRKIIWDGKGAPEEGDEVLVQLGSLSKRKDGGWVRHKVVGMEVVPSPEKPGLFIINILLDASDDPDSWKNQRNLADLRPLDWQNPL